MNPNQFMSLEAATVNLNCMGSSFKQGLTQIWMSMLRKSYLEAKCIKSITNIPFIPLSLILEFVFIKPTQL